MPKPLKEVDPVVFRATQHSIETAPEGSGLREVFSRLEDHRHIVECIGHVASKMPILKQGEHYKRLAQLLLAARYQTLHVLDGAALFLELHGHPKTDILGILSDTSLLARKFGRIGGKTTETVRPADDFLARQCKTLPLLNFTYAQDRQRVSFSDHALQFIERHSARENGCPAMGILVEHEGVRGTLYDLAWRQYSDEYLTCFRNDEPIVFIKPTDEEY